MLTFDEYIEKNYNTIRSEFEEMLSDQGYYGDLSEVNDGWREYQEQDYEIYLLSAINNEPYRTSNGQLPKKTIGDNEKNGN